MVASIIFDANEHPIKSVTVFKSNKAEVARTFNVSVEGGQTKIRIRHLPDSIDTESARVTGLGDAQLFDVVCSVGSCIDEIDTASTAEAVRKLDARKDMLVKDVESINSIAQTMMTYSQSLAGDSVSPRQAERFFENLFSRSRDMTSARADLEEEILQLSRQIDALSSAEKKKEGKTGGEVSVVIMSKEPTEIQLKLTYLVRSAIWSAAYELHATTEAGIPAPSVSLHYRARITQSTGEDWTDVKLTLSTADMDLSNKTIPVLRPTKIQPPRTFFQIGAFGAGRRASTQKLPPQGGFGSVPAAPSAFGQPAMFSQAQPMPPPQGGFGAAVPSTFGQVVMPQAAPQGGFGSVPAVPSVFGQPVTMSPQAQPTPPSQVAFGSAPAPGAFGQPASMPVQAQPAQPMPLQNTFGASALFGSSAQTTQAAPRRQSLFGPSQITQPTTLPVDEWQDIEKDDAIPDGEQANVVGEQTSVVHESQLSLTYHVEGASGVPSDGVPHQVTIAVLPFEAKIQHLTVPKVRPVAYLQATVKNTSDYRLLPGVVHAFVDDSFVSKTGITGDVAPGDVFTCTLGADPSARIRYVRTCKRADDDAAAGGVAARERNAFSEQWAATMYRSRTTVTNRHPFTLRELVVRDGVPVCEDEKRVSVVLRRPAGLAELEQGKELQVRAKEDGGGEGDDGGEAEDDADGEGEGKKKQSVRWCKIDGRKEGLFEWVVEVGAGEELTIDTEWDVKAPVSLKWIESTYDSKWESKHTCHV